MVFRRFVIRTINGRAMHVPVFSEFLPEKTKLILTAPRRPRAKANR